MKIFILLMLLSTFALTEEVKCSCERFNKDHCEQLQKYKKCGWLDDKCLNYRLYEYYKRQQELQQQELLQQYQSKLSKPESMYCKDLEKDKCKSTNGCAYYNQECIQFPGCSLFDTSHCSESSTQCHLQNSQCVEYKQCKHLIVQDECGKIEHLNGVAESCQWKDDKCSEKECEDAPEYYFIQCDKYLNKCSDSIKNGEYVGCQKKTCNTYKGLTKLQCTNIITNEGKCDKSKSINICYGPGDCTGPAKSQEMCEQFGDNCFYNGKECLPLSQLKSCNYYMEDCDSNIGLEGQCKKIDLPNCYSTVCSERFCYQLIFDKKLTRYFMVFLQFLFINIYIKIIKLEHVLLNQFEYFPSKLIQILSLNIHIYQYMNINIQFLLFPVSTRYKYIQRMIQGCIDQFQFYQLLLYGCPK